MIRVDVFAPQRRKRPSRRKGLAAKLIGFSYLVRDAASSEILKVTAEALERHFECDLAVGRKIFTEMGPERSDMGILALLVPQNIAYTPSTAASRLPKIFRSPFKKLPIGMPANDERVSQESTPDVEVRCV